ncbi:MAG: fasciclin domain-containing protein, partial [Flavisolibacter sp.]|nr:fasciclin domain-containing protein [Flavisolibacter sp.]
FLKAAITKASTNSTFGNNLNALLSDSTGVFTFFAPTDAAFQASGFPSAAAVSAQRAGLLDTILRYHLVPGQKITSSIISQTFPNMQEPTALVLAPPSASLPPGLRMSIFPSKRGTLLWANNIPITQADIAASNGVVHKVATLVAPPSQYLWDRINNDPDLTYLKAAIQRADSGVAAASTLQAGLQNPAANLTVFAPTNLSFQQLLTAQITAALIAQGMPSLTAQTTAAALASSPTVFTNPALASVLTPTLVKGVVVYHLLGVRSFSVNIPSAATNTPTLLNTAVANHPGVSLQATFGPTGVTAATVKGVANASASNILINPTPAPNGTSDQHYINGVLHKIDQVLIPQ